MNKALKRRLVSFLLTNQPGEVGKACSMLAENNVSILGIYAEEAAGKTVVNIVTDSENDAELLKGYGISIVNEKEILETTISAAKGSIAAIATTLGNADVNIETIFGSTCKSYPNSRFFLEVDDVEKAVEVLRGQ